MHISDEYCVRTAKLCKSGIYINVTDSKIEHIPPHTFHLIITYTLIITKKGGNSEAFLYQRAKVIPLIRLQIPTHVAYV